MRRHTIALLMALLIAVSASPMSAQEDSSESPSPGVDVALPTPDAASPEPAQPPKELGGAWRRTKAGPFGAIDVPGGWTGKELVIVDPDERRRAASYRPTVDRWETIAKPPRKLMAGSTTHWTGSELLFIEPRGSSTRGLTAYDPGTDAWRATAPSPINEIAASVWADGLLLVTSADRARAATYDPVSDVWTELPSLTGATPISLHWTGEEVLALVTMNAEEAAAGSGDEAGVVAVSEDDSETGVVLEAEPLSLAFVSLDLAAGEWGEPSIGPLTDRVAPKPLWIGGSFVFLSIPDQFEDDGEALPVNAAYDPVTDTWSEVENACGIDTTGAVWTGTHLLSMTTLTGWKAKTDRCLTLPSSPWPARVGSLQVWTGKEVLEMSGSTRGTQARRDGTAYDPFGKEVESVALDKGSRPVRVRVPSLGIDLPVVWDGRKVSGSSPGYPACDVAEYWSAFGLPGEPGTSWILAHAQQGMFLPLLSAFNSGGKRALLGRTVEVQLRDGRSLTYRIYRVDPRATNTRIGSRNLKQGEHRLVLQTSTGIGPAPKLVVAARLVDATMTDEPRPKPNPRACG